jgi:hypothetical protein
VSEGPDNLDLNLQAMQEAINKAKAEEDARKLEEAMWENE